MEGAAAALVHTGLSDFWDFDFLKYSDFYEKWCIWGYKGLMHMFSVAVQKNTRQCVQIRCVEVGVF